MAGRHPSLILVYSGKGSNQESRKLLHHALKSVVDPSHHSIGYIQPAQILEGSWTKMSSLIAFGGGYDLGFESALGKEGARQIRRFVEAGGSYLGICAGAYWACDYIQFDKGGPLEVTGERFLKLYPGLCIGPTFPGFNYRSKMGVHAVPLRYRGMKVFDAYSEGGGLFRPYSLPSREQNLPSAYVSGTDGLMGQPLDKCSDSPPSAHDRDTPQSDPAHDRDTPQSDPAHDRDTPQTDPAHDRDTPQTDPAHDRDTPQSDPAHDRDTPQSDPAHGPEDITRQSSMVDTLGTYSSLAPDSAAIVKCRVGRGVAILSGVHVEFSANLLDKGDIYLQSCLPRFVRSEDARLSVFKDILGQLGVKCLEHPRL